MEKSPLIITKGHPQPYGCSQCPDGINFAISSEHAKKVSLCIFTTKNTTIPIQVVELDPKTNKTGAIWHVCIQNLKDNNLYAIQIDDRQQFLLDPYAKSTLTTNVWGAHNKEIPYSPKAAPITKESFDWHSDKPLLIPLKDLIIYEMHVRGFTNDQSSNVKSPGTFLGVIEKIPHLVDLGVNAVELLPVFEWDECEYESDKSKKRLYNYWGYSTINFFSPMQRYAAGKCPQDAIKEFKMMVKELHRNGIEVILDVVYNHTGEGNEKGPTLSFKGIDNNIYYIMNADKKYANYTGCGNTFNCNQAIARELIHQSLRYWVSEMHVDGFRFDLASIFMRDIHGNPVGYSPIVDTIVNDPYLKNIKLIVEPWDAAGLYQVGQFYQQKPTRLSEWNARYRDTVRRFIKGTGRKEEFVTNICGSQDLYHKNAPTNSINFITAHDGFSLADLVSYNSKHNQDNGENNQDGNNNNDSWNCGVEGPTTNKTILELRHRQMRNYHLALMVSRGVPMILMGDEYSHTRHGNNNTWCQDNELNWFLWDELEKNQGFYRYYKGLIHFRRNNALLRRDQFLKDSDIEWHGHELFKPNWNQGDQFIAFRLKDATEHNDLYIAFNPTAKPAKIQLPYNRPYHHWVWVVNTSHPSPKDFSVSTKARVSECDYTMLPYSSLMLQSVKS